MLWYHLKEFCYSILGLMVIVTLCAFYAYYVNSRRPADDPKKRNYHPLAVLLAPITFPVFAVLYISFFLLRVLIYGMFILLFIVAMIFIRQPFILEKLQKGANSIGDRLLQANSMLVQFFLNPWKRSPESV